MSASDYLEGKLLDHYLRNVSYTPPTTVYVALYTVVPGEAGGGTEVSGGGYARQSATFSASWANTNIIEFPNTSWSGTIQAIGLFDAVSGGNLLNYKTITSTVVASGENFIIGIGSLTVSLD